MASQNLKPLIELQSNATLFFNQFYQKYQAHMQCKAGCAQCCYVELSVFEGEAMAILEWVQNLSHEKKQELLFLIKQPEQPSLYKKKKACIFLRNNKCSIYEARPIICRTQGAALQYKTQIEKENTEINVNACPLNFTQEETFPEQKDWLDLDRLNALQSIAENFFQKNKNNNTIKLQTNKEGRIELKTLKDTILKLLENT